MKAHAQAHPHKLKASSSSSKTKVSHMRSGDFFGSEVSATMGQATTVRIEHVSSSTGAVTVLKPEVALQAREVIDAARMDCEALRRFIEDEIDATKAMGDGVLLSLHLKATMMKVSDPIMFGHAVSVYYKAALEKHQAVLADIGFNPNNGIGDLYGKLEGHPLQGQVEADLMATYDAQPPLAMVDSGRGITNLHAPNDVIISASVPPVVRDGGQMWTWQDTLADTNMLIPDHSYATMYAAIVEYCKRNGALDASSDQHPCSSNQSLCSSHNLVIELDEIPTA